MTPAQQKEADGRAAIAARQEFWRNFLRDNAMKITFKLKDMSKEIQTDYPIQLTDLKIPTGYDLEST